MQASKIVAVQPPWRLPVCVVRGGVKGKSSVGWRMGELD